MQDSSGFGHSSVPVIIFNSVKVENDKLRKANRVLKEQIQTLSEELEQLKSTKKEVTRGRPKKEVEDVGNQTTSSSE